MEIPAKLEAECKEYRKRMGADGILKNCTLPEMDFLNDLMCYMFIRWYRRENNDSLIVPGSGGAKALGYYFASNSTACGNNKYYLELESDGIAVKLGLSDTERMLGANFTKRLKSYRTVLFNELAYIGYFKSVDKRILSTHAHRNYGDINTFISKLDGIGFIQPTAKDLFRKWSSLDGSLALPTCLWQLYNYYKTLCDGTAECNTLYNSLHTKLNTYVAAEKYGNESIEILDKAYLHRGDTGVHLLLRYISYSIEGRANTEYVLDILRQYIELKEAVESRGCKISSIYKYSSYAVYKITVDGEVRLATQRERQDLADGVTKEIKYFSTQAFTEALAGLTWLNTGNGAAYKEFRHASRALSKTLTDTALIKTLKNMMLDLRNMLAALACLKDQSVIESIIAFYAEQPEYASTAPNEAVTLSRAKLINWAGNLKPVTHQERIAYDIAQQIRRGYLSLERMSDRQLLLLQRAYAAYLERANNPVTAAMPGKNDIHIKQAKELIKNKDKIRSLITGDYSFHWKVTKTAAQLNSASDKQSAYIQALYNKYVELETAYTVCAEPPEAAEKPTAVTSGRKARHTVAKSNNTSERKTADTVISQIQDLFG